MAHKLPLQNFNSVDTPGNFLVKPLSLGHTVGDRRFCFRWRSSWSARRRSGINPPKNWHTNYEYYFIIS